MKREKKDDGPLPSAFPIALVGIGCRFPGARGPEELWRTLIERRCSVGDVPQHRIDLGYSVEHYFDPRARIPGRISSIKAGFVEHPEKFDPVRFGLTPRDAAAMEPQARMMLEVTWDAIEDAGLAFETLRGERVAVIVGHTAEDFSRERIGVLGEDAATRSLDVRTAVGYARAAISGRISHLLDLRGPSMTVDTACSSSLYATHQACQSLWLGESRMALAGGVNLFLTPEGSLALSRSGMMAADGCCKAFDARADGFVRAEGAGAVLLRPLADALENGDRIYAVIRGSGISADGRDGGHMMAPGREGQAQAMRDAYRRADLLPGEIDFLEAHGTGTAIGDPIEAASLGDVMGEGRDPAHPLRISSIKGNIGHAESASGMAGLIKAALAVERRVWPGQLHFETPNPSIDWENLPVEVQVENAPWPHSGVARAAVNSFGISGTNAHIVLEGPPAPLDGEAPSGEDDHYRLFPLSAHGPAALTARAEQCLDWLRGESLSGTSAPSMDDLGHTLARRKSHFGERLAIVANSASSLVRELEGYLARETSPACLSSERTGGAPRPLVFVFPGQGGQWAGMAQDLVASEPGFRAHLEAWDQAFRPHVSWSLVEILADAQASNRALADLAVIQPILVALQAAIADWLIERGARPGAVVGQSVGEIPAAYVAGILSRPEAARLACLRGAAVARAAGRGAMGLVGLSEEATRWELGTASPGVEIAGQSAPAMTLVAGDRKETQVFLQALAEREIFARPLEVDFASHCFHMDPLLADFAHGVGELNPAAGHIPFYSSVCGDRVPGETLKTEYWVKNLRERVRFVDAVDASMRDATPDFVEISPHPTGIRAIGEIVASRGTEARAVETLRRGQPGEESLLRTLAALFAGGHSLEMNRLHSRGQYIGSPLYPHQLRTLWFGQRRRHHLPRTSHPLLGVRQQDAEDERSFRWEILADTDSVPSLALCQRDLGTRLPASLCTELILAAAADLGSGKPNEIEIEDFTLSGPGSPTSAPADSRFAIQVKATVSSAHRGKLQIFVQPRTENDQPWQRAATATFHLAPVPEASGSAPEGGGLEAVRLRCPREIGLDWPRAILERHGAAFPRGLDSLRSLHLGNNEFLARLEIPPGCQNDVGHFHLHPVMIEMGVALAGAILLPGQGSLFGRSIEKIRSCRRGDESVICHARLGDDPEVILLDIYSAHGKTLARLDGVCLAAPSHSNSTGERSPIFRARRESHTTWLAEAQCEEFPGNPAQGFDARAALAWGIDAVERAEDPERASDLIALDSELPPIQSQRPLSRSASRSFVAHTSGASAVQFRSVALPAPGPGEVRVEVHSAPLSQLDIRCALGLAEAGSTRIGREFSGVVRAIGPDISHLEPGDPVFGLAQGAIASHVVAPAHWVAKIPSHLMQQSAAALPLPYLVARRVLSECAKVEAGTRILLLAGAGGVGLALTHVASRQEGRVLALASNPARRDALLESGAEESFCGEVGSFDEDALAWSEGKGFDLIISSLDDSRIENAAGLLAPGGTFVDLRPPGSRGFTKFPPLLGNRNFASFDFDAWLEEDPQGVASSLRQLAVDLGNEEAPTTPLALFPAAELHRALRFASQNRSTGRVVLDMRAEQGISIHEEAAGPRLAPQAVHWVSGSDAGRIEAHAQWLHALGARRFVIHSTQNIDALRIEISARAALRGFDLEFSEGPLGSALAEVGKLSGEPESFTHLMETAFAHAHTGMSKALSEEFERLQAADLATRNLANTRFLLVACARDLLEIPGTLDAVEVSASCRALRRFAESVCEKRREAGLRAASIALADPIRGADSLSQATRVAMESLAFEGDGHDGLVFPAHGEDLRGLRPWALALLGHAAEPGAETRSGSEPLDLARLGSRERREYLRANLLELTASILALSSEGRERFDAAMPLVDMGLDSLMASELSIQVLKDLGQTLTAQIWATRPGVDHLVDYLDRAIEDEKDQA
ncbi:MAG: beta-ketoacyl synthase N-terminal-like domain-containing protein [Myxococcota bacterium]|nr:beta-ketoacyl synthase N-terminal-like domain-containing protein [Myxococcota bacterium]